MLATEGLMITGVIDDNVHSDLVMPEVHSSSILYR
jgi:hypothetical protein